MGLSYVIGRCHSLGSAETTVLRAQHCQKTCRKLPSKSSLILTLTLCPSHSPLAPPTHPWPLPLTLGPSHSSSAPPTHPLPLPPTPLPLSPAGGQISIDVFPTGWDKTFALSLVDLSQFREVHFFGDKTAKVRVHTHTQLCTHCVGAILAPSLLLYFTFLTHPRSSHTLTPHTHLHSSHIPSPSPAGWQ